MSRLARRSPATTAALARRRRAALAWSLLGIAVALLAASLVFAFTGGEGWNQELGTIPVELVFAVVGALVVARTGNLLGWLFLTLGTVGAVSVAAISYAGRTPAAELPGAAWAGWTLTVALGAVTTLLVLIALLFPDGRPPSRRWWPVAWLAVVAGMAQMVTAAVSDVDFSVNFGWLRDPVTLVAPLGAAYNLAQEATLFLLLVGVAGLIVRFRRSGPEQRLQVKWFVYAAVVSAVAVAASAEFANNVLISFDVAFPLVPASVGIAILKYRLYDIDRLISRTLAYAIVTGLLVGVYAGLVLLATEVLGFHTAVAVAAATLAAAALFNPVRLRVQRIVDRRFNRVRYDADQTVAAFAAALRGAVDLDTVRANLLTTVNNAVEPAHISLWQAASRSRQPT
jgi:hypothetical protein